MPKNEEILGKYSNQENRDANIHVYELAEKLNPELCLDLRVTYIDDDIEKDQTEIFVLAQTKAVNCIFTFGATIDSTSPVSSFIFGDTFGNAGKGTIDFSSYPVILKLRVTDLSDNCTSPYYREYELYRVKGNE